jgi:AraC-like DNA-binding protein
VSVPDARLVNVRPVRIEDRGGWCLVEGRPHDALRPFFNAYDGYWEYEPVPSRMRTLPSRHAVLILNLGPPMRLTVPGAPDTDHYSFLAGMQDRHGAYTTPGGQRGIQIDITPLGAYTLFGVPMGRLANLSAGLDDLLGPCAGELVERLADAPGWPARFDLLDAFWLRRLEIGPAPSAEVARAWHVLTASGGRTPVTALADEVGWSRKHLHHRFKEQVGLSPKVMGRVLRFERAVRLMAAGGRSWADIAADCGYYDQAHLNREVRALAGCTPTELLAAQEPERLSTTTRELPDLAG